MYFKRSFGLFYWLLPVYFEFLNAFELLICFTTAKLQILGNSNKLNFNQITNYGVKINRYLLNVHNINQFFFRSVSTTQQNVY